MKNSSPATAVPTDTRTLPLHEDIATQAHVLWAHYGQPSGRDVSIWLEAERQVLGVDARVNLQAGGAVEAEAFSAALTPPALPRLATSPSGRNTGHR